MESPPGPDDRPVRWRTLALDSVRIHEIPGSHAILVGANETPIAKASIKAVADQIRGCLDEIPEGG